MSKDSGTNKNRSKKSMIKNLSDKYRLVFLDIRVDPEEHVYPMQIAGGSVRDLWLSKTERS